MINLVADLLSRSLLWVFALTVIFTLVRYLVVAGGAWYLLWGSTPSRHIDKRLRPGKPPASQLKREIVYSLVACLMHPAAAFTIVALSQFDLTRVYFYVSDYGWPYLLFSIVVMVLMHDALFYWLHRLLHTGWFMRNVHYVHHESDDPSPWSSLAFHPIEALLHVLSLVVVTMVIPVHPIAMVIFLMLNMVINVLGHCGFEVFPQWLRRNFPGRFLNTPSMHSWHHFRFDTNFSIYFTFWDKLMGTSETPAFERLPSTEQERYV